MKGRTIDCFALRQVAVVLTSEESVAVASYYALDVTELHIVEEALHVDVVVCRGEMGSMSMMLLGGRGSFVVSSDSAKTIKSKDTLPHFSYTLTPGYGDAQQTAWNSTLNCVWIEIIYIQPSSLNFHGRSRTHTSACRLQRST